MASPHDFAGYSDEELIRITDPELIPLAQAEAMRRYEGQLHRLAQSILGCPHLAEDAVRLALPVLQRHWGAFRHLRSWLKRVVANKALDLRRQQKRRPVSAVDPRSLDQGIGQTLDPLSELLVREKEAKLWEALARLPEDDCEFFIAIAIEKVPQVEIARALGDAPYDVSRRVSRIREQLKRILKELDY